jgi:outer membrane protein OmpA-like peptidoglycan-associated protein
MIMYRAFMLAAVAAGFAALAAFAPAVAQQATYPGEGVKVNAPARGAELLYPGVNNQDSLLQPGAPYPGTGQATIKLIPPDQLKKRKLTRVVSRPPEQTTQPAEASLPSMEAPVVEMPARHAKKKALPVQQATIAPTEPLMQDETPQLHTAATIPPANTAQTASAGRVPFSLSPSQPNIVIGAHGRVVNGAPSQAAPAPASASRPTTVPVATEPAAPSQTARQARNASLEPTAIPASLSPAPSMQQSKRQPLDHAGLTKRSEIVFTEGAVDPTPDTITDLRKLAIDLTGVLRGTGRVELEAFGGPPGDKSSDARRLSLKRALAVRALLIESGVPAERIDVRALGGANDGGTPDRVDVFVRTG